MAPQQTPNNRLLAALPKADWDRMKSSFRDVALARGTLLRHAGEPFDLLYFPTVGVISKVALFETGATAEIGTVGPEGMSGVGAILGSRTALSQHVVQIPGAALAIRYSDFRHWQQESEPFRQILLNYAQLFMIQVLQSVACNAVHAIEGRAARWLLTFQDRSGTDTFPMTQQLLADMLGVSRPVVNTVARSFQRQGLITYRRGMVVINDRPGLEAMSCECYNIIQTASRNLWNGH